MFRSLKPDNMKRLLWKPDVKKHQNTEFYSKKWEVNSNKNEML